MKIPLSAPAGRCVAQHSLKDFPGKKRPSLVYSISSKDSNNTWGRWGGAKDINVFAKIQETFTQLVQKKSQVEEHEILHFTSQFGKNKV